MEEIAEQAEQDAPEEKNRGVPTRLMLPIMIVLGLALGGVFAYGQYTRVDRAASFIGESIIGLWSSDGSSARYGQFIELKNIIVNPAGTRGQRYLLVTVGLESSSTAALEEVKTKEVVIRDTMLTILSQYTVKQLSSLEYRHETETKLISAINDVLGGKKIDRLYFTRYVLQ